MDNHYALMGDLSDAEDQQPHHQEVRLVQVLVRRQIIGRTLHPSNPIRRSHNRQRGGHQIGERGGPRGNRQEFRRGGNRNGRERRRAGRQGWNNDGNGRKIPPKRKRGRFSRKAWKDGNQVPGDGEQSRYVPYQDTGSFGYPSFGGGDVGPYGPAANFHGGHGGCFGSAPNFSGGHFDPVQNNRGPFGQSANSGSGSVVQPFGQGQGSSGVGLTGNAPT